MTTHGIISAGGSQALSSFHWHAPQNTQFPKHSFSVKIPSAGHYATMIGSTPKAAINGGCSSTVSLYALLGISEKGTLSEIKQAYKQLARKYHPDVSPADRVEEHTERFIKVHEAYEILSDPRSRALYDRDLDRGLHVPFSASKQFNYREGIEVDDRGEWKRRWWSQLTDLKCRCRNKDRRSRQDMSWGARMRRKRKEGNDLGFDWRL